MLSCVRLKKVSPWIDSDFNAPSASFKPYMHTLLVIHSADAHRVGHSFRSVSGGYSFSSFSLRLEASIESGDEAWWLVGDEPALLGVWGDRCLVTARPPVGRSVS